MSATSSLPDAGMGEIKQLEGLTVKEAAYMLRVAPQTVYGWCYQGKVRFFRIGGSLRIKVESLETVKEST